MRVGDGRAGLVKLVQRARGDRLRAGHGCHRGIAGIDNGCRHGTVCRRCVLVLDFRLDLDRRRGC